MNAWRSMLRSFLSLAVMLTLLAGSVVAVQGQVWPMVANGIVYVDVDEHGDPAPAPVGTEVRADVLWGSSLVGSYTTHTVEGGQYVLSIPGELGYTVEFFVLGMMSQETCVAGKSWRSGDYHLDLHITRAQLVATINDPTDGETKSTEQTFDVSATVRNDGVETAIDASATIAVSPEGRADVAPVSVPQQDLAPGEEMTVIWALTCTGPGPTEIVVTPTGLTSDGRCPAGTVPIPDGNLIADTVTITQELKAHLAADATAPEVVTVGLTFIVSTTVSNTGEADALGVIGTIEMTGGAELAEGETITKEIGLIEGGTISGEIGWTLACTETGDVTITVTPAGTDENTGEPVLPANIVSDTVTVRQQLFFYYIPFSAKDWSPPE